MLRYWSTSCNYGSVHSWPRQTGTQAAALARSKNESRRPTNYAFSSTTYTPARLCNIWVTVSPRSLHPGIGTDSDRPTQLTMSCREHAPGLANVVSSRPTLALLPGTVCLLIYMTLQTQIHSRSGLKLFCLIVHTDVFLLLYGAPGRFVERRPTNRAFLFVFVWSLHSFSCS